MLTYLATKKWPVLSPFLSITKHLLSENQPPEATPFRHSFSDCLIFMTRHSRPLLREDISVTLTTAEIHGNPPLLETCEAHIDGAAAAIIRILCQYVESEHIHKDSELFR
jgi:hypothetical protein